MAEILSLFTGGSIGGQMKRLEDDYAVVSRKRPILSKGKGTPQNEVDIVAIHMDDKKVLIGEVKRQRKNFKPELLQQKVELLRTKVFFKYDIDTKCFAIEDM